MTEKDIQKMLFEKQDKEYRDFQAKLIPDENGELKTDSMIGVRTPDLRSLAKALARDPGVSGFLSALPHKYFDENQLHAFIISETRDYETCMAQVKAFLPYVDNWATCDQMNPKVLGKKANREALLKQIKIWLKSKNTYEVRFAIRMLMCHFLDEDFDPKYLQMVAKIRSEEYYINMMIAWYFATALAKQYEAAVPILEAGAQASAALDSKSEKSAGPRRVEAKPLVLSPWVQNKTIQKACESYRVSDDQKTYLRTLKIQSRKSDAK